MPPSHDQETQDYIRRSFLAFKSGAGLKSDDVRELLAQEGVEVSNNRLREMRRASDRGQPITARELYHLISAWAREQNENSTLPASCELRR